MSQETMTLKEFWQKIDYEGGYVDAFHNYGLSVEDLAFGELSAGQLESLSEDIADFCKICKRFDLLFSEVMDEH